MKDKLEHVSNVVKNIGDLTAGTSVLIVWITSLTPLLEFAALSLALIWGWYRIVGMKLSNDIKRAELREYEDE